MSYVLDPTAPLTASGNLRRRQMVSRVIEGIATASALLALLVLGIVIYRVVQGSAGVLSLHFVFTAPKGFYRFSGTNAILEAIVGTVIIVAIATAIAMPFGVLVAVYATEYARPRAARAVRLALDMTQGLPSVIVSLFVLGLLFSAFGLSGILMSMALAVIMLPLIARATQEVLLLVPTSLREGAEALGVARWRAVLTVILPTVRAGILTGTILAAARAAGETAPVLFLNPGQGYDLHFNPFGQLQTLTGLIYTQYDSVGAGAIQTAWGASFVLLSIVLLVSVSGRAALARIKRGSGQ